MRHSFICLMTSLCLATTWAGTAFESRLAYGQGNSIASEPLIPEEYSYGWLVRQFAMIDSKNADLKIFREAKPDALNSIATLHQRVLAKQQEHLQKNLEHLVATRDDMTKRIRQIQDEYAKALEAGEAKSELPMINEETTSELLRQAAMEFQHLQWELASEEASVQEESQERSLRIAKVQMESRAAQLESARKQLEELSTQLNRMKQLYDQGSTAVTELSNFRMRFEAEKSRLASAEAEYTVAKEQLAALADSRSSKEATQVLQLRAKQKVLTKQIENLKHQRSLFRSLEQLQHEKEQMQQLLGELRQRVSDSEIRLREVNAMLEFARSAVPGKSSAGPSEKPSEK